MPSIGDPTRSSTSGASVEELGKEGVSEERREGGKEGKHMGSKRG